MEDRPIQEQHEPRLPQGDSWASARRLEMAVALGGQRGAADLGGTPTSRALAEGTCGFPLAVHFLLAFRGHPNVEWPRHWGFSEFGTYI